jgi:hypothetical protein
MMRKFSLAFFSFLLVFLLSSSLVFAERDSVRLNLKEKMDVKLSSPSSSSVRVENREEVRERAKNMLEDRKLQACKAREEAIKNRKGSLLRLATESLKRMDVFVEKIKNFYQEKVVASGKSVSNYNDLLAEVERTRLEAVSSLDKASKLADEFRCNGDNPKEVYKEFRLAMQQTKEKLYEYRKAIKNLLVAVRKAAVSVSESPSPKVSPEAE